MSSRVHRCKALAWGRMAAPWQYQRIPSNTTEAIKSCALPRVFITLDMVHKESRHQSNIVKSILKLNLQTSVSLISLNSHSQSIRTLRWLSHHFSVNSSRDLMATMCVLMIPNVLLSILSPLKVSPYLWACHHQSWNKKMSKSKYTAKLKTDQLSTSRQLQSSWRVQQQLLKVLKSSRVRLIWLITLTQKVLQSLVKAWMIFKRLTSSSKWQHKSTHSFLKMIALRNLKN